MAKYLLLKHYRGAPSPLQDIPMDQWHVVHGLRCASVVLEQQVLGHAGLLR